MNKVILKIDGMHCEGCAKRIENSLSKKDEVKSVQVSFEKKEAIIEYTKEINFKECIEDLGFQVVGEVNEENNIKD